MARGIVCRHDKASAAVANRILALAGSEHAVRPVKERGSVDVKVLEADLQGLPAGTPYVVVHLGAVKNADALIQAAEGIREAFADFPKAVLRQWFVLTAGRKLDNTEQVVLADLHGARRLVGITGIVVCGQSSQSSVSHNAAEQAAFAADVAYALLTTDLGNLRLTTPDLWAIGSCSVVYDKGLLRTAVAALLAAQFVRDRLLADPSGDDPLRTARAIAEDWVKDLAIGSEDEQNLLLQSSRGNVRESLRVRAVPLPWSQVSSWPDRLASWYDFLLGHRLPAELEQIDENLAAREQTLREAFSALLLEELRRQPVIDRARLVVSGLSDALHDAQANIGTVPDDPDLAGHDLVDLKEELEVSIQRLPYPAAVAVRSTLLGIITAVVASLVVVSGGTPSLLAGAVAAGLSVAWGAGKYARRSVRVIRARDEYLEALTDRLMGTVLRRLDRGRILMVQNLLRWAGGDEPPTGAAGELVTLGTAAAQALQSLTDLATNRTGGDFQATEYARLVPSSDDEPTEALLPEDDQDPRVRHRLVAAALFESSWNRSAEEIVTVCLEQLGSEVRVAAWNHLGELLRESPSTRASTIELLSRDVTPLLIDIAGGQQPERSRCVYLPPSMKVADLEGSDDHGFGLVVSGPGAQPRLGGAVASSGDDGKLFAFDIVRLGRLIARTPEPPDEAK